MPIDFGETEPQPPAFDASFVEDENPTSESWRFGVGSWLGMGLIIPPSLGDMVHGAGETGRASSAMAESIAQRERPLSRPMRDGGECRPRSQLYWPHVAGDRGHASGLQNMKAPMTPSPPKASRTIDDGSGTLAVERNA